MHPAAGTGIMVASGMEALNNYIFEHPKTKSILSRLIEDFNRWIYELENQY